MKIIVVIFILLAAASYYAVQNGIPDNVPVEILSTKISRELAVEKVKQLPEVQQYLKDVPNGKVEVDNELEGEYNVHVYEIKDGHTATFNWYRVSIKSGEVRAEFEVVQNLTGTVTGKLCYPSEVLPEGKIEAKRLSDGEIFVQDYKGSLARKPEPYAFELEEGDYYLRYYVAENLIGYSTTVCPTGMEESCGDKNPRILRKAQIKKDRIISDYDLCDYYFKDSNAPKF